MVSTDRDALLALYNATGGANWRQNENWNTDAALSQWHGVVVNAQNRVVELYLRANSLEGHIPRQLGDLSALETLDLSYNELEGHIPPELGDLRELRELWLNNNRLTEAQVARLRSMLPKATYWPGGPEGPEPPGVSEADVPAQLLPADPATAGMAPPPEVKYDLPMTGEGPSGRDGLDYGIYVKALADLLRFNDHDLLPAAVGIYAPWGAGKTFLLDKLEVELLKDTTRNESRPDPDCMASCRCCLAGLKRRLSYVVIMFVWRKLRKWLKQRRCFSANKGEGRDDLDTRERGTSDEGQGRDDLDTRERDTSDEKPQRQPRNFIFVKFNAWECAGSEVLWAALVSKIFTKIEQHEAFGQGAVRKKRVEELLDKHIWDWCGLGVFFSFIALFGVAVIVALYATDTISAINQVVAVTVLGVPGVAAILTFAKFVFQVYSRGVFGTAQGVLRKASNQKESVGDAHLGFMSEVKIELEILFKLVNDRNVKREKKGERGFTIGIIIDDLDRCPDDSILRMLRATHLLLEQPGAQMVVFLAVDPRIIISAIDGSVPDEVNGLVYLDKIIHIPFCIPPIPKKNRVKYVKGLLGRELESPPGAHLEPPAPVPVPPPAPPGAGSFSPPAQSPTPPPRAGTPSDVSDTPPAQPLEIRRGLSLQEQAVFTDLFGHIKATPRKIKRAVNVYVLQRSLAVQTGVPESSFPALAKWTILTEFWPCRMSGIILAMRPNGGPDTILSAYTDGERSARSNRQRQNLKRLYLNDSSEESFEAAMMGEPPISKDEVLDTTHGFILYSLCLNPAIMSKIEAEIEESPGVDHGTL